MLETSTINMHLDGRTFTIQGRQYFFEAYKGGYQNGAGIYKIWDGDAFKEGGTYSIILSAANSLQLVTKPAISDSRLFYCSAFIPEELTSECIVMQG